MNPESHALQFNESDRLVIEEYRKAKNTAVLTILFTDVVGSTNAAEKLGENEYLRLKDIHDDLVRSIIERGSDGRVIKEIGDSFLAVYSEPSTAVERALEIQEALKANLSSLTSQGYALTVRMGLHMGQVSVEDRTTLDVFGRHVNRAARVMGMANGGQVLTTAPVWDNASGWLRDHHNDAIKSQKLGSTELKGIDERIDIYEFYTDRLGSQGRPDGLKERKRKPILLAALGVIALLLLGYFTGLFDRSDKMPVETPRDVYYLHFDMSALEESATSIDSNRLKQQILSEVLSVVYPDSIATYEAAERLYAGRGEVFRPSPIGDTEYYRDELSMAGIMSAEIELDRASNPILNIFCRPFGPYNAGTSIMLQNDDALQTLRSFLLDFWIKKDRGSVDMSILDVKDSTVILRFANQSGFRLQPGTELRVSRNFAFGEEREEYMEYVSRKIKYYSSVNDSIGLNEAEMEYDFAESRDYEKRMKDKTFIMGDVIGAIRVVEVFDSTATADLILHVPWTKPLSGDRLTIE